MYYIALRNMRLRIENMTKCDRFDPQQDLIWAQKIRSYTSWLASSTTYNKLAKDPFLASSILFLWECWETTPLLLLVNTPGPPAQVKPA